MNKLSAALLTAALISAPLVLAAPATASTDKVDICHAAGKDGKYVPQSISKDGTANGHAGHQDGADIIPAYSWVEDKVRHYFAGQNLDKAGLLTTGCKAPAVPTEAAPLPPVYVPGNCSAPSLPYGEVVVPDVNGEGPVGHTDPVLNEAGTQWTVSYVLAEDTEDIDWSWPAGTDGTYTFDVVPISADPMWVTDSVTGVGACEMPDTGASSWMLPAGLIGGGLITAGFIMTRRRTN